ncbi:hypothetical protein E4U54_007792 [Claviceps lovelessii]|nr:hypothetical protein E4U54_007792 [Claviceps lovelessii]
MPAYVHGTVQLSSASSGPRPVVQHHEPGPPSRMRTGDLSARAKAGEATRRQGTNERKVAGRGQAMQTGSKQELLVRGRSRASERKSRTLCVLARQAAAAHGRVSVRLGANTSRHGRTGG